MYSESLLTPHPRKTRNLHEQQGLYEAAELDRLETELAFLQEISPEQYEDTKLAVATEIGNQVNKALWFPTYSGKGNDFFEMGLPTNLPPETITASQATNCLGYSIVTSECLDKVGIEHWLSYSNGHAFVLIPHKNKDLYLLDSLSPVMNQFAGNAVERGNVAHIRSQLATHERAAIMVNTQILGTNIGRPVDDLAGRFPWLKFEKGTSQTMDTEGFSSFQTSKYQSQYRLITSVFPSEQGREKFAEYMRFQYALACGNTNAACASLSNLNGFYPELDARQSHGDISALVTKMCLVDPDKAVELTEQYFTSNFQLTQDSRIPEARGDILRKIARITRSDRAAEKARDAYQEAAKRPYSFKEAVLGKFATAQGLLEELAGLAE